MRFRGLLIRRNCYVMSLCGKCTNPLPPENDFVSCRGCNTAFDYVCAGVRETNWRKLSTDAKQLWRCAVCKAKTEAVNVKQRSDESAKIKQPLQAKMGSKAETGVDLGGASGLHKINDYDEKFYLKELLKSRDMVIQNQADLIISLKEQINLLKATIITPTNLSARSTTKSPNQPGNLVRSTVAKSKPCDGQQSAIEGNTPSMNNDEASQVVTRKDVCEAVTRTKLNDIIHLTDTDGVAGSDVNKRTDWKTVPVRRNRRETVIGERVVGGDHGLRAAIAFSHWHVYRLHPDTTVEEVEDYLKVDFPHVKVEILKSFNPAEYSSFKVSVREADGSRLANANLWPSGARINRFFLPRKKSDRRSTIS